MGNDCAWGRLVAEVDAVDPLRAGDALPRICSLAQVFVARYGVAHDEQGQRNAPLRPLQIHPKCISTGLSRFSGETLHAKQ